MRVSGAAVPESAKRTLSMWSESYGSVRLYDDLTIIEFADDYALRELLNTTSLADHMICQLSSRMVVIDSQAVDALMAEMIKKDYMPKLEEMPS